MKLFRSLIKCENCNSSYIHLKQGSNSFYICNKYKKGLGCKRNTIKESEILWLVERHFHMSDTEYDLTNQSMKSLIDNIIVRHDGFIINYKDNLQSIMSPLLIQS